MPRRRKDMTDMTIGSLFVVKFSHTDKKNRCVFECRCKCGAIYYKVGSELRKGQYLSCVQCPENDLTGQTFGSLRVLHKSENKVWSATTWLVECKCGKQLLLNTSELRRGIRTTCGCRKDGRNNKLDLSGKETSKFIVIKKLDSVSKSGGYEYICLCKKCNKELIRNTVEIWGNRGCPCKTGKIYVDQYQRFYSSYQKNAIDRNFDFPISFEDFMVLIKQNCYYCGAEPTLRYRISIIVNGIDRLDNKIGYLKENIVTCCSPCNFMKRSYGHEEFINQAIKIANHQKGQVINETS